MSKVLEFCRGGKIMEGHGRSGVNQTLLSHAIPEPPGRVGTEVQRPIREKRKQGELQRHTVTSNMV